MSDKDDDLDPIEKNGVRGTSLLHLTLGGVFPEWSSNRISQWLGINPRTLQRMLSKRPELAKRNQVPEGLAGRIHQQQQHVQTFELGQRIDDLIDAAQKAGIDDEVIGAWLAHRYKRVMGRDVD